MVLFYVPLKEVSVDDEFLYVSNLRREIKVRTSSVVRISEFYLMAGKPVTIRLDILTEFGDKIRFIPKPYWRTIWKENLSVDLLRKVVDKARASAKVQ